MPPTKPTATQLFHQALLSDDPAPLECLRERASELLAALDEEDITFTPQELQGFEEDPTRLFAVCALLARTDSPDLDTDTELETHIEKLLHQEDREIAQAVNNLRRGLAGTGENWACWFEDLPRLETDTTQRIRQHWGGLGADDETLTIADRGVTPATFFEAAHGLSLLLQRQQPAACSRVALALSEPRPASPAPFCDATVRIPYSLSLAQLRSSPDCPPEGARAVLRQLGVLAAYYPSLIPGFRVIEAAAETLTFEEDPSTREVELLARWRITVAR